MDFKIFNLYLRICKATKQTYNLKELNEFEKELKQDPNKYKVFDKKLNQLGY
ncbi:hypothetical protein [Clostridium sporogenes]|uniref:hypothetical protein n=1 Tax=Clostridium sporogenes TaxID=1509 RepID=UPI000729B57D|nr:hypothetical protein [Clostridium sporogenes]KRU40019.1 hypothetical protein VT94_24960 [Clostridium sporogenes]MBY7065165.1 hypothetical protein [Clostridium sporogenes]MBY7071789.1 hypothetical protein [Clostridium sporogenes]MCW6064765.1 hypothetical protein [Clostridium sporogenes]OQP88583.1 hypothetical protein VT93_0202270 [Clostridium sporogenes]